MSSSDGAAESWIASFCSLMGHEYFAEVSEDFIEDDFNLTGLQSQVPMYKDALEMILDVEPEEDDEEEEEEEDEDEEDDGMLGDDRPVGSRRTSDRRHLRVASDTSVVESSAELLYGLIHQRYITSRPGIQQMLEKYEMQHFGVCPRVFCNGCKVLPVGRTDTPGQETVKLFCPSCLDIYTPPNSRFQSVDGAFFGTTFGCLFFMTFPDLDVGTRGTNDAQNALSPTATNTTTTTDKSRSSSLTISGTAAPATDAPASAATTTDQPPTAQPTTINGMPTPNLAPGLGLGKIYEPRIYGFRVAERAKSGPRMKWLRSKPLEVTKLDESSQYHALNGTDPDGEEHMRDTPSKGNAPDGSIAKRKKAQIRKRRVATADSMTGNGGTSGLGIVGANGGGDGEGG